MDVLVIYIVVINSRLYSRWMFDNDIMIDMCRNVQAGKLKAFSS